jgi:hypothetical protein
MLFSEQQLCWLRQRFSKKVLNKHYIHKLPKAPETDTRVRDATAAALLRMREA